MVEMIDKKCPYCGKDFTVRTSDRNQQYCSRECGRTARAIREREQRQARSKAKAKGQRNMKSVVDISVKARLENLTYGQYVAKYGL